MKHNCFGASVIPLRSFSGIVSVLFQGINNKKNLWKIQGGNTMEWSWWIQRLNYKGFIHTNKNIETHAIGHLKDSMMISKPL